MADGAWHPPMALPGKKAGAPLTPCPFAPVKRAPDKPCNLNEISLTLTPEAATGKPPPKPVTVRNTEAQVRVPTPLAIPADDLKRMNGVGAYIHLRAPFTAAGSAAPSAHNQSTASNTSGSRVAKAKALAVMGERCGNHAGYIVTQTGASAARKLGTQTADLPMVIERAGLDFDWFKKLIFDTSQWSKLGSPASDEIHFEFDSCGAPSKGAGRPSLTGLARFSSLDDWTLAITSSTGWGFEFGTMRRTARDHVKDTVVRSVDKTRDDTRTLIQTSTQGGVRQSSQSTRVTKGDNQVSLDHASRSQAGVSAPLRNAAASQLATATAAATVASFEMAAETKKKQLVPNAFARSISVSLTWNGQRISTDDVVKVIGSIIETLFQIIDAVCSVYRVIKAGLDLGFPITFSAGFELKAKFIQGNLSIRRWCEARPPWQGAGFYITAAEPEWQLAVSMTVFDMSLTGSLGVNFHIIHEKVLSLGVGIQATLRVAPRVEASISSSSAPGGFAITGQGTLIIQATGDGVAGPYYVSAEATAQGGVNVRVPYRFDGTTLTRLTGTYRSTQCTLEFKVYRGNKLRETFSVEGQGEPWMRYPKRGPLVLFQEGALNGTI